MGYCRYALNNPFDEAYHNEEWGVPLFDDNKHFEFLAMEVMQCGLSWNTILKKRKALNEAFEDFQDIEKIANYSPEKLSEILRVPNIIKSPRKIATISNNAKCFLEIQKEFGSFSNYIWNYTNHKMLLYDREKNPMPTQNDLSDKMSKDMKNRGFRYLGPVVLFSHMQAAGLINDHDLNCPHRRKCMEMINYKFISE